MNLFSYPLTIVQINFFEESQNIFSKQNPRPQTIEPAPPSVFLTIECLPWVVSDPCFWSIITFLVWHVPLSSYMTYNLRQNLLRHIIRMSVNFSCFSCSEEKIGFSMPIPLSPMTMLIKVLGSDNNNFLALQHCYGGRGKVLKF